MVDDDSVYPTERQDGELRYSECCLERGQPRACVPLRPGVGWGKGEALSGFPDMAYVGDGQVGHQVLHLRRIAVLELLERPGRSGDKHKLVRRRQQRLGNGQTNAAAGTGHNDHVRFHLECGDVESSTEVGRSSDGVAALFLVRS